VRLRLGFHYCLLLSIVFRLRNLDELNEPNLIVSALVEEAIHQPVAIHL